MSDTPRVDAVLDEQVEHDDITFTHVVELARQLERELAAATKCTAARCVEICRTTDRGTIYDAANAIKNEFDLLNGRPQSGYKGGDLAEIILDLKRAKEEAELKNNRIYRACPRHQDRTWNFTATISRIPLVEVCPHCEQEAMKP